MKASYNQETKIIDTLWDGNCPIPDGIQTIEFPDELLEKFRESNYYTFKYENNQIVEYDNTVDLKKAQIDALKQNLINTDYQAIKYAEGQITTEEYAPIKAQRQAWREEINELEGVLESAV